jgi:hypothetical protein
VSWRAWCLSSAVVVAASWPSAVLAGGVPRAACVSSYERGQEARRAGSLREAAREFATCGDDSCPAITKTDCVTWLGEVAAATPSVSLVVLDAEGRDLTEGRVQIDGEVVAESLDGKALPVDPGKRAIQVTTSAGAVVSETVLIREGEKLRRVELRLGGPRGAPAPSSGGPSIATWVVGAAGGAALIGFGVVGGLGLAERSDAESTCAPRCTDATVASIEDKFLIADVLLGVGLAALGAAIVIGIVTWEDRDRRASARLELLGVAGGGLSSLSVDF